MPRISGLIIYPVKSCRGIELKTARLTETGLQHDRQWVIVDAQHQFLTQRTLPRIALIHTALTDHHLILNAIGQQTLRVPLDQGDKRIVVQVWKDACDGFDTGDAAAIWLSEFLRQPVRLVRFDPMFRRLSDSHYTGNIAARNMYADGFPLLVISQASLDDLNERLAIPLPMNRFRPNIVIDGIGPFDEDRITHFSAPGLRLQPVKPCTRCAITATDQDTAMRSIEPLLTLAAYRINEQLGGVTFGQNVIIAEGIGQLLHVGDEWTAEWNF